MCDLIDKKLTSGKTSKSDISGTNKYPCPPEDSLAFEISGFIKDKQTLKPIADATVFLLNTQTGKAKVLKTDAKGQFKTMESKGILYVVKGMENNYLSDCLNFTLEKTDTSHVATIPRDIFLDRLELDKIISIGSMDYSIETIYYDFNKWFIRPDAEKELNKLVQVMKENPVTVELGSHTDSRGSKEYNLDLSQKRAESAVRYIVLHGIDAARITAKGYGESQLINHCMDGIPCSPREHQANRRTEFKVTGFSKAAANPDYDMKKFKSGEEIPEYLLDHDFFIDCLQDRRMKKTTVPADDDKSILPSENKLPPAVNTPGKVVKTKEPVKTQKQTVTVKPVSKPEPAVVKKQENDMEPSKSNVNAATGAVTYRVQVYALNREKMLSDEEFDGLEDVQMYVEDGMYKYTTGIFKTHAEAIHYRDLMVQAGFNDAFVVTFANGKRIYISPAY